MPIVRLQVRNVRNLKQVSLPVLADVNIFYGSNGSGKTSLLEAVHLLLVGRPFRGPQLRPVLAEGADECTVFVEIGGEATQMLGMQRSRSEKPTIKLNGQRLQSLSELVRQIPVQVINAESFQLLNGGPSGRRAYLDWGLFHVEHDFHALWQAARRALMQRNALIRRGKIDRFQIELWSREYALHGSALAALRKGYAGALAPIFRDVLQALNPGLHDQVSLVYAQGWPRDASLEDVLLTGWERDAELGYTRIGPHRADLKIQVGGLPAADRLSRGQLKLIVASLRIAQARLLKAQTGRRCLFLVDDLPAELDAQHRSALCRQLEDIDAQVLVTCIDPADLTGCWQQTERIAMFHVEHGAISPVSNRSGKGTE